MKHLLPLAMVGLAVSTPVWADDDATAAFVPAPQLNAQVEALFGNEFKLLGPVKIAAPDQSQSVPHLSTRDPIFLSVAVAFKRTARLDTPMQLSWADNPLNIPAGSLMFYEEFPKGPGGNKTGMWCTVAKWSRYAIAHYMVECIDRTADGKAVAYQGMYGPDGYTVDDVKGGYNAVQWYAFGYVKDQPSQPFNYPAMTEMDMPQPDMAIQLRIAIPDRGKPLARASWVLRGPLGDIPSTGQLMEQALNTDGTAVKADLGGATIAATLDEKSKELSGVHLLPAP